MFNQTISTKGTLFQNQSRRIGAIFILACSASFSLSAATDLDSQQLIQLLGVEQQDAAKLDKGEVVFFNVAEGDEKELAAGAAIYLKASPSKIISYVKNKGLASIDTDITAEGVIPLQATLDSFKGFNIKAGSDEAADFLAATPGSKFNLSTKEFQDLKALSSAQPDAASQAYRNILLKRWQSYRQNGLKGIKTYDRGNGTEANPAGELRTATQGSKILARYFPELYKAWLNYPAALPADVDESFFWRMRQVENRPTALLVHRLLFSSATGQVVVSRQFYVGHSYNSNQLVVACLPYLDGSLVVYANRTFTDQVAGFGSSLKRSIGQKQAQDEMVKQLKNLRKVLK